MHPRQRNKKTKNRKFSGNINLETRDLADFGLLTVTMTFVMISSYFLYECQARDHPLITFGLPVRANPHPSLRNRRVNIVGFFYKWATDPPAL